MVVTMLKYGLGEWSGEGVAEFVETRGKRKESFLFPQTRIRHNRYN